MAVRPLRDAADVRELTVAHARAWRAAHAGLLPEELIDRAASPDPSEEHVAEQYERLGGYGPGRVFVAEDEGGTVRGYAVFRWPGDGTKASVRDGEAELKELYVDPDHWGEGHGTALLAAGIERLPEAVESLALETLEGNDVAADFYEARGFERDGRASFEVEGDAYPTVVYRRPV